MDKQPVQGLPLKNRAIVVACIWFAAYFLVGFISVGLEDNQNIVDILQITILLSVIGGVMVLADIQNRIVAVMMVSPLVMALLVFGYYAIADIFF